MKVKSRPEAELSRATLSMLVEYYIGDMQRRNLTLDSSMTNKRVLSRFVRFVSPNGDDVRLSQIGPGNADQYVSRLQGQQYRWEGHPTLPAVEGHLSPFTIRKEVKILRAFGAWLAREGFDNPFDELAIPKVPKPLIEVLTDDEIETILAAFNPQTAIGARLYAMFLLLLDSGLRVSELAGARLGNLDLERRQVRVMGKGEKERIVPFGTRSAQALMRYVQLYRPEPNRPEYDNLFLSMDGLPMTRSSLESVIWRLRRASGVKRLHPHLLRHTFAVKYLLNGGDVMTLQLILGHESLEVTRLYLHLTNSQVKARYDSFSPVDKLPLTGLRRFGNRRKRG